MAAGRFLVAWERLPRTSRHRWWLHGSPAIVFGHVARHQNKRTGQGGNGMALAGLILGDVALAAVIWVVVALVLVNSDDY